MSTHSVLFEEQDIDSLFNYIRSTLDTTYALTMKAPNEEKLNEIEKRLGKEFEILRQPRCKHSCDDNCCFEKGSCHCGATIENQYKCMCNGGFFCGHNAVCNDSCENEKELYITIQHDLMLFAQRSRQKKLDRENQTQNENEQLRGCHISDEVVAQQIDEMK